MRVCLGMVSGNTVKIIKAIVIKKCNRIAKNAFKTKFLFFTNVGISFTLSGVGDVIEQHCEILQGTLSKWDKIRSAKMSVSGIPVGIFCHHYYLLLDKHYPGRTLGTVTRKLLIDQFICSPVCITIFYITVSCLERQNWSSFVQEFKVKALRLYLAEWVVWPVAQIINFYFLPTRYRVLYDSTISLGYDIYTSHVKHDDSGNSKCKGSRAER